MNYKLLFLFVIVSCTKGRYQVDMKTDDVYSKALNHYNDANNRDKQLDLRLVSINKAYELIRGRKTDTFTHKVIYRKAILHYSKIEYDSMLYFNNELLNSAKNRKDFFYLGKAYYLKAFYYDDVSFNLDSSFYYYNKSKNNFLIVKDSIEVGKKLLNMAIIQKNLSDYFGSKETITEALKFLPKKDEKYIPASYNLLATNHNYLLNFDDAILYYNKAIGRTSSLKDILVYKNNLANTYIKSKKYNLAIKQLDIVSKDTILNSMPVEKYRVYDNLAYARWLRDTVDVEIDLINFFKNRIKYNDKRGIVNSCKHLGEFYLTKDQNQAIYWLKKGMHTSKSAKNPQGELDILRLLMTLKPNSLKLKNRYIMLNDSLYKNELRAKTQFAKIRYDDKLKNEEIKELKTITKNQQLEVTVQQRQKIIYLLLGLIVIILAIFYSYYLIQKHKKDKEKEVYRTEKLISKRVHDEIANDISLLANLVGDNSSLQNPSSKKILESKLQNVYLRARDISTDISSIDLKDFKEELKNLIIQYNTGSVNVITNLEDFEWSKIADHKKIAIYRVLQELFINTKKHSNCKRITLMLKDKGVNRIITYTDDGVGFNKNKVKFNGLSNAENRIENIGGSFNFETNPDKGVKVIINIKR